MPAPPGKMTMPCPSRTNASRRFSMSGMMTSWLTIGIRRLGRDDARLGDAQVAAVDDALLGVPDGRALHRSLHGAGPAAGAHVEAAQPELVADFLGVVVLDAPDGMPAPAHHQVRPHLQLQHPRVAQDVKYRVGDARGGRQIEAAALDDLVGDEHHVAQHREQMILQAPDHFPVDECRGRRVLDLELDAPGPAHDAQIEVPVLCRRSARASSRSLPELSTASAHLRNSGYRPPWPESSSLAISCCERCSRLPLGATRASTRSDDRIVVSTRHLATDRCRSGCCPGCASTLRPCRNWTRRCSRPSSHSRSNRPPDASGHSAGHGS